APRYSALSVVIWTLRRSDGIMKQPGNRSCFAPVAARNRQGDSRGSAASSPYTNLLKTARPVGGCTLCRGPESGSYRRLCPRIDLNALLEKINLKKKLS